MAKFRFRLQPVLRYRERTEEAREQEFVRAMRRRADAQREVERLQVERHRASLFISPDPELMERRERYVEALGDQVATASSIVDILHGEEQTAREAWYASRRDRQAIDRLREIALVRHRGAEDRKQQAELDDWAVMRRTQNADR